MATAGILPSKLDDAVKKSKLLVVGAGGIGCELLKNLVLCRFENIEIIDLDTIDVTNLNRQFLFQKQHVGKSKAMVAKESVLRFNPNAKIVAHHASVMSEEFGANFFKQFNLVLNALDNQAARNHVNRICIATEVPLIESGTAGYSGQVELILKGRSKCYECDPKPAQKTFPGCTIRNTPSEPIHCIVWAKHLFNQLFGEADPDEDVSPDTSDPDAAGDAGENALNSEATESGNVTRTSTRTWAVQVDYDPEKLFTKLFNEDIKYLLQMSNLWKSRRPPEPLNWNNLPDAVEGSSNSSLEGALRDQKLWSVQQCGQIFAESVHNLKRQLKTKNEGDHLIWDKDDKDAMDFVAACANIRAHIFAIPPKSRFDVKSMAGNIIPAIATSNAIVAGLVVVHALKVLEEQEESCPSVYLRTQPNPRGQVLVPERGLIPPNPKCTVCSSGTPQVWLYVDTERYTCKDLESRILKGHLNMIAPDVMTASGCIVISSEEGETESNNNKLLKDIGITDGSLLTVDDFLQQYTIKIVVSHRSWKKDEPEFSIEGDPKSAITPEESEPAPSASKEPESEEDDLMEVVPEVPDESRKRKHEDDAASAKKSKVFVGVGTNDDPIII